MATANISVSVDGAIGKMNALSRQVPFAMSVALNRTYDEAQFNIRRHIERVFVLRTPNSKRYILRTIRREKRDMATKKRLYADVRLQSPSRRHPPMGSSATSTRPNRCATSANAGVVSVSPAA